MDIFYVGGNGQLAQYLRVNSEIKVTERQLNSELYFDLEDIENSPLLKVTDSLIVFGAAISKPALCEKDSRKCREINFNLTFRAIKIFLQQNRVIFISSDLVFGGVENKLIVNSPSSQKLPLGLYGELKSRIEDAFLDHKNFYVARLSYVLFEDNSFFKYLDACHSNDEIAEIIHPVIRHVTRPIDILRFILQFARQNENQKISHIVGPAQSRIDLFSTWLESRKLKRYNYKIIPIEDSFLKDTPNYINIKE